MLNCYCREHLIFYVCCGTDITAGAQYATFTCGRCPGASKSFISNFSFLATFHSFLNARYTDILIDRNDFDAGFLITFRKNIILHCKRQ
jgi:hypothetical protein